MGLCRLNGYNCIVDKLFSSKQLFGYKKTRESFAAPEESVSPVSRQDLASTFPQKNSEVSSGCAEVKLEQLSGSGGFLSWFPKISGFLLLHFLPVAHSGISGGARPSDAGILSFFWCYWM